MHYMMLPLRWHYDGGYGAMAVAFFDSAKKLRKEQEPVLFLEHLPIDFLFRHAIELYLKSGIVIVHKRLNLLFDDGGDGSKPVVLHKGKPCLLERIHTIGSLFAHWKGLVVTHEAALKACCKFQGEWTIEAAADGWVTSIDEIDAAGTFYRYPSRKNEQEDDNKSPFKAISLEEAFALLPATGKKIFALGLENADGEMVGNFVLDDESGNETGAALEQLAVWLNNYHAMMRFELTGGG